MVESAGQGVLWQPQRLVRLPRESASPHRKAAQSPRTRSRVWSPSAGPSGARGGGEVGCRGETCGFVPCNAAHEGWVGGTAEGRTGFLRTIHVQGGGGGGWFDAWSSDLDISVFLLGIRGVTPLSAPCRTR